VGLRIERTKKTKGNFGEGEKRPRNNRRHLVMAVAKKRGLHSKSQFQRTMKLSNLSGEIQNRMSKTGGRRSPIAAIWKKITFRKETLTFKNARATKKPNRNGSVEV